MNATMLARIERAHLIAARLDAELLSAQAEIAARRMDDPVARARALAQARKAS